MEQGCLLIKQIKPLLLVGLRVVVTTFLMDIQEIIHHSLLFEEQLTLLITQQQQAIHLEYHQLIQTQAQLHILMEQT